MDQSKPGLDLDRLDLDCLDPVACSGADGICATIAAAAATSWDSGVQSEVYWFFTPHLTHAKRLDRKLPVS